MEPLKEAPVSELFSSDFSEILKKKSEFEKTEKERKSLEKELLSDEKYISLLEKEKELKNEYAEKRDNLTESLSSADPEKFEVEEGTVSVSQKESFSVNDYTEFETFVSEKGELENLMEKKWKATKVAKFIHEEISCGNDVPGTISTKKTSLTISVKK